MVVVIFTVVSCRKFIIAITKLLNKPGPLDRSIAKRIPDPIVLRNHDTITKNDSLISPVLATCSEKNCLIITRRFPIKLEEELISICPSEDIVGVRSICIIWCVKTYNVFI